MALAWAIRAKNTLQNQLGHSPNELVFGSTVNTPSIWSNLPALEYVTTNCLVNVNVLYAVNKSFMEGKASENIWQML